MNVANAHFKHANLTELDTAVLFAADLPPERRIEQRRDGRITESASLRQNRIKKPRASCDDRGFMAVSS